MKLQASLACSADTHSIGDAVGITSPSAGGLLAGGSMLRGGGTTDTPLNISAINAVISKRDEPSKNQVKTDHHRKCYSFVLAQQILQ